MKVQSKWFLLKKQESKIGVVVVHAFYLVEYVCVCVCTDVLHCSHCVSPLKRMWVVCMASWRTRSRPCTCRILNKPWQQIIYICFFFWGGESHSYGLACSYVCQKNGLWKRLFAKFRCMWNAPPWLYNLECKDPECIHGMKLVNRVAICLFLAICALCFVFLLVPSVSSLSLSPRVFLNPFLYPSIQFSIPFLFWSVL